MIFIIHDISYILLVNDAAIDASVFDNDTPTSAAFNAAQSFAPSPHIPVINPLPLIRLTNVAFYSGCILAYIFVLNNIFSNIFAYFPYGFYSCSTLDNIY